ncbi:MAG: adenosine-specific kinase [Candidatus Omnitrophica bacterium]|jgi:adenosine/AMP kinase|nr:adenosine-specific kinase [Candidatus Omnitrophota bacterium]
MKLELEVVEITKPEELNVIIGHSHFIKTVEDIYEVLVGSVPNIKFGLAFCEASGKRLIRLEGNDDNLKKIALENSLRLACGHMFFIALDNAYPVNVLNQIKNVPEVCRIFCASANPLQIIVGKTSQGRAIMAVIDGLPPLGVESDSDIVWRKELLRKIKYKL